MHRPAAVARQLPEHAGDHQRGRGHRLGGDPPGLRLPVGERGLRRARREERLHVRRPARRDHPPDGRQGLGHPGDEEGRRALRARLRRPARHRARRDPPHRARHRLPGDHQGLGRRRRPRHARRAQRGDAAALGQRDARRGARGVRQRPGLHGEIPREAAPHRVPGARRPLRQRDLPRRARLLHAAPPPEGDRGSAGAGPHREAAQGR